MRSRRRNTNGLNAFDVHYLLLSGRDCLVESLVDEGVVAEIKSQWKRMWQERIDDHVRAEGVAFQDYDHLFVERGTVVLATRDFKLLSLKDILELHKVANAERFVPPNPNVGGWGKFVRTHISSGKPGLGVGFVSLLWMRRSRSS